MPLRILLARLAIAFLSTAVGGCSFAFVNGPPPNHKTSAFFDCTSSNALPIIDSVVAAGALLDAVGAGAGSSSFVNNDGTMSTSSARTSVAIAYGAGAALLAASAGYGFKKTSECRDAEADLIRRTPVSPVFTGGPPLMAPRGPYDPWVAHPPVAPVAPPALAPPTTAPGAPAPAPSSPWDVPAPAK